MIEVSTGNSVLAYAAGFGPCELHFCIDPHLDLYGVIVIHSTRLGPALGGCRCLPYGKTEDAVRDAIRLARGMSYKAAICRLPLGGGKAVLIRPQSFRDRNAYFEAFGDFVENLGGRYITSVDSGTSVDEMDIIARRTRYVTGTSTSKGGTGNPSPSTALGVYLGIKAAVRFRLKRSGLEGLHVAIQGLGQVGRILAGLLHDSGARLTVTDIDPALMAQGAEEFGAEAVPPDNIYDVDADVFAPCALGGILNSNTVPRLRAAIVAGAANNQLASPENGEGLFHKGILYAPDYVVNAGGLIHVAMPHRRDIRPRVETIHDLLMEIFAKSTQEQKPPESVADSMAESILNNGIPGDYGRLQNARP